MMNLIDWKMKLAAVVIALVALFGWHTYKVKIAVHEAVVQVETNYAKEKLKLMEKSMAETQALKDAMEKQKKVKDEQVKTATAKYNNLSEWVRNLPSTSTSSVPGDSSARENGSEDIIGELRRRNAQDFVNYSRTTEALKIEVLSCYRQYDQVKTTLDDFRKNSPRN